MSKKINFKLCLMLGILLLVVVFSTVIGAAGTPTRDRISEDLKWNLADIYPDQTAWQADFDKVQKELIPAVQKYKGKLTNTTQILACLKFSEELNRKLEKVYVYAHLKADENQANNDTSELSAKTETLNADAMTALAFFQPEILAQSDAKLKGYLKDKKLQVYQHYFASLLQQKPHTLSQNEEEILARASDMAGTPQEISEKVRLADMKYPMIKDSEGKEIQLTNGIYSRALESKDREYRKRAFEGVYSSFDKAKNTLASALSGEVKKNIFFAKSRKYESALEASLAGENIPRSVYDNLVKSVNDNISVLNRYVTLRKKVLKLDKVHVYDMYVPLLENYELKVTYEEAKQMLQEGLKPLGEAYLKDLAVGLNSRWVDVCETDNKRTGAYQWGTYDTHPYVLTNYMDSADDMLTLGHEMGHAMNSFYTNKTQPYVYSNVPIFTAEVASTTNELLMNKHLIAKAKTDQEKLFLINNLIENIRGSVFTQVMYAEFEKTITERVEQGEALSAKSLNEIWKNLMVKYYGSDFVVDELAPLWWSRIPHFYMNFYVYKYATSMAAANQAVLGLTGENQAAFQIKYLDYLKAGSVDYPINVLKKMDIDMTDPKVVDNLLSEFNNLLTQMEEILKKQGKI